MHFNAYNLCMVSFWQGLAAPMAWLSERIKLTEPSCEQVHKEQTSNGMKRHEKASKGILFSVGSSCGRPKSHRWVQNQKVLEELQGARWRPPQESLHIGRATIYARPG